MPRREAQFPALKQHISKVYLKQAFPTHTNLALELDEFGTWEVGHFQFSHIFKCILRLLKKSVFQVLIEIRYYLYKEVWFKHPLPKFKCEELNSSLDYQLFAWHWQHKRDLFCNHPQNHAERLHTSLSLKRFLFSKCA